MGLFGKFKKEEAPQVVDLGGYQSFSTPFLKVPKGDLSLPYINSKYAANGYVAFGQDNLAPQLWNQLYYSSPLHGAIVNYKTNAVIGGGYTFDETKLSAKDKVNLFAFTKKIGIKRTLQGITKDLILHERVYFMLTLKGGNLTKIVRVGAEKVRTNKDKSIYYVNDDWQYNNNAKQLTPYHPNCKDGEYLFVYECESVGQDIYPIPQYTSALNFAFLSGELSYLQKSNIQNSIFPSFAMMFPKKPQGKEEMELIRNTVEKAKGAENGGKAIAFFANNKEQLPELVNIPTNSNDELFRGTSELITEQICFAHTIDPILLGVRTTGSLGNGSDIKQAYIIFEKNVVTPLRESVTDIVNAILKIADIDTKLEITNFQIINETITVVEDEGSATMDALNSMSPLVATKVLEMMTINEVRALAGLPPVEGGDVTNCSGSKYSYAMIYFVTETYLKNNTPITKNVDVKDVTPYIRPASDMRVQSILGTYFYEYLLTQYNAQNLSQDETSLVEKIQPVVAWRAAENAVFGLSYQLKNKGVQVQFGDYSQNVSQGEIAFVMDHYGQMAAFFEKRLINYLLENKDLFAEFTSALNKDSDIKPVDECTDDDYDNTMMVI